GLIKKNIKFDYNNFINYFTLGHPTAAQKLVSFVSYEDGVRTTAYSHERIIFIETMGMHAGWLALSSSLGDPDFIIIPEFPLNYEDFLVKLLELYKIQRHAVVVVAEGARWGDGRYISSDENEKDDFGHPRFKGSAEVLAKKVKRDLSKHFDTRNINSVNPSYLYRSGKPSKVDKNCAFLLGNAVIEIISSQLKQSVFLSLTYSGKNYNYEMIPLKEIINMSNFYRQVDDSLYDHKNYQATDIAKKYWSTFIKSFPKKKYGVFI
ncbi:MAG: 6-phosphofructokinase, partial [Ignavibacterium sp.]|nr:6-phosphofructokinase [Ignavibacterium sp.]MDW8374696.1 6-phosphofructokinase [Ignavibacteriales bacterium]